MSLSFDGQRILILGAGVTGNAVARSLIKRGAVVSITDENPAALTWGITVSRTTPS